MERRRNGNGSHGRNLAAIIELYLTSCRIEGKAEETVRLWGGKTHPYLNPHLNGSVMSV